MTSSPIPERIGQMAEQKNGNNGKDGTALDVPALEKWL